MMGIIGFKTFSRTGCKIAKARKLQNIMRQNRYLHSYYTGLHGCYNTVLLSIKKVFIVIITVRPLLRIPTDALVEPCVSGQVHGTICVPIHEVATFHHSFQPSALK